ncbi:MAG: DUF2911 domain-containing protein [Chryseobacterium sp.]|uniref:DUF2911 domain-containing protein n=1 Tax=Chryseobacterium sp. TaxID=1871047 RepID=UPI0025C24225|nr:DUF2911 domain-containing protein [Chryseobacterium sp.]MCJ7932495.1 DUF2911 domain-containing protein [Chryseobacterium sp.]
MKTMIKSATMLFAAMTISVNAFAQDTKKPASPPATATGKIKDATITIAYSSPSVKGRTIWGGLEAYDKVWRAGANEATTFETDKDITVQGKKLPAGKYSFFLIPKKTEPGLRFSTKSPNNGALINTRKQKMLCVLM